jgi:hypothetical protein
MKDNDQFVVRDDSRTHTEIRGKREYNGCARRNEPLRISLISPLIYDLDA